MIQNKELELKTLVTKEQFYQLLNHYTPHTFIKQTNHYYSSSSNSTNKSIRVREKQGQYLFTLKEKKDGYVQEYEKIIPDLLFEKDAEIKQILAKCNLQPPYHEIGVLTTERFTYISNKQAELCFDINHYNGITDYEIEYEVIASHNYLECFTNILKQANIDFIPNPTSKVKRCLSTKKGILN